MLKKFLSIVVVMVLFMSNQVQAQFNIGLRAGFNLSNVYGSGNNFDNTKIKPGFQVGIVGEYFLGESVYIQPGISFATQGFITTGTSNTGQEQVNYTRKTSLHYIQVPINIQYKWDLGEVAWLFQGGPYLGYGLGGKVTWKSGSNHGSNDVKFEEGYDAGVEYYDSAIDFGIGIGTGIQFHNFQFGVGYHMGLTSLLKSYDLKNNGLTLTATYMFGK